MENTLIGIKCKVQDHKAVLSDFKWKKDKQIELMIIHNDQVHGKSKSCMPYHRHLRSDYHRRFYAIVEYLNQFEEDGPQCPNCKKSIMENYCDASENVCVRCFRCGYEEDIKTEFYEEYNKSHPREEIIVTLEKGFIWVIFNIDDLEQEAEK